MKFFSLEIGNLCARISKALANPLQLLLPIFLWFLRSVLCFISSDNPPALRELDIWDGFQQSVRQGKKEIIFVCQTALLP